MLMYLLTLMAASTAGRATPDFVDFGASAANAVIDMRYAGSDNFVGRPIDGYRAARCLLARPAAEALGRVQAELEEMGLTLRVFDCYRPQRAVTHFVRWAKQRDDAVAKSAYYPNVSKSALFAEGYIADRSGHSRGATVDLSIEGLNMGGPFDLFDPQSHTASMQVEPAARANRLLLTLLMEKHGFKGYSKEWWHYTFTPEPYPDTFFNVPVD